MSNLENTVSGPTDSVPVQLKPFGMRKHRQRKPFVQGERRTPTNAGPPAPPTALSTKASVMRDDPFLPDEFEIDGMSLQPTNLRPEFAVTHSGFMDLVVLSYEQLCHTDRYFIQTTPFSIYAYYCGQLLLARLNELDKLHHRSYDIAFDQLVLSFEFECPEVITRYLQSLGETKSPGGELFRLAPRTTPLNATGDFGRYTPATSVQYHQT